MAILSEPGTLLVPGLPEKKFPAQQTSDSYPKPMLSVFVGNDIYIKLT